MPEYLNILISFVIGGGINQILNLKFFKRNQKLDFADKAMKFMEDMNDGLLERVGVLEDKVKSLTEERCQRENCNDRIK